MTKEEKVKAYDEVIKRAKVEQETFFNLGNISEKTAIERIFPELKESKDEKIKKSIIELVKQSSHILNPMNQKSMIAWLEKQQPKQEWSEYDKIQLDEAIQMIEANGTWIRSEDAVKKVSNWLKSFKPCWKPSKF